MSKTRNAVSADPSQVMSTPTVSKRLMTVEVCEKSLISRVSPPSNKISPTASETIIGKNSPSSFGWSTFKPSAPRANPPSNKSTIVGR